MRRTSVIVVAVVIAVVGVVAVGAYAYDNSRNDTISAGVSVGGVDVGGLSRAQARAKLQRELLDPLARPIVLRRAARRWRLSAREAQHLRQRRGQRR